MFKLWKINLNLKKEIILSSLKFNLNDVEGEGEENEENLKFKDSILDLILLNLNITFNAKELFIDILPLLSKFLLDKNEKLRLKTNLIFKDSLTLILNNSNESFIDIDLIPLNLIFPGISNVNLIETNQFKDGLIPSNSLE